MSLFLQGSRAQPPNFSAILSITVPYLGPVSLRTSLSILDVTKLVMMWLSFAAIMLFAEVPLTPFRALSKWQSKLVPLKPFAELQKEATNARGRG
jgi:hypothetical protein